VKILENEVQQTDDKNINIGELLKNARESKGLTIEKACEETRISKDFLRAVEDNQYSKIPGEVFVKGILRTYGNYLGLDGTKLIEQYKIYAQGLAPEQAAIPKIREATHVTITPTFKPNEDTPKNQKNSLLLILVAVVVVLLAVGAYYFSFMVKPAGQPNAPVSKTVQSPQTQPAPKTSVFPQETNAAKQQAVQPNATVPKNAPQPKQAPDTQASPTTGKVNVDITCKGICWLQVYDNNKLVYEGTMGKDEKMHFASDTALRVVYGNIRDVHVNVNGKAEPAMDTNDVVTKNYGQSEQKGI
jgi:cytoskeleton protein RodZ